MGARVCDRCQYNIISQVVTVCPNCGSPLPRRASSTGPVMTLVSFAFLALLAVAGITIIRQAARMAEETPPATHALAPPMRPAPPNPGARAPGAPSAAASLVGGLGSSDVARRREAAEKLAEAGDRPAANALMRALKDRDDTVRQLSTYALARMSARGAVPPGDRPAVAAAVRPLLNDRYELARSTAAYALGELRDRSAVPGLLRALGDSSATVRSMSATALGTLKEPRAVRPLIPLLADETTVWAAAQALGEIGNDEAAEVLIAAYDARKLDVVAGAHAFYLRRRTPGYDKVLLELLQSRNDLALAQTLIQSNDPRLAGPARKWASEQGWALVKDPKSPTGVRWTSAGSP